MSATTCRPHHRATGTNVLFVLMLAVHALILGWSATWQSPTLNEPGHLASGVAIWKLGRFDVYRVNPPLVRAIAAVPVILAGCRTDWHRLDYGPGVRSEFDLGIDFVNANGPDSIRLFNLARWVCIPFSLLGAWSCFLWGRALCGPRAGLLACALWCFNPNILACAQLIAPDIGGSSLALLASYQFWNWLKSQSWASAGAAGVSFGLSLLAKSSWVILFGLWPLIWLLHWILLHKQRCLTTKLVSSAGQLAAILVVAIYVLNMGYLFDGTMTRLGDFQFVSQRFGSPQPGQVYGNVYKDRWYANLPIPLPQEFVLGIDHQKKDFENFPFPSYLRGEWRRTAWWYYYLYALAVKVPAEVFCLLLLALCGAWGCWKRAVPETMAGWSALILPGVATLIMVSSQPTLNHHFRYVLPLMGPLFVFAASSVRSIQSWRSALRCRALTVTGLCVVSLCCSTIMLAPGFLAYFNLFVGGARQGHRHLIHSNLDWGQDLYYLKQWMHESAGGEPVYLAYHGFFNPSAIGVSCRPAPYGPVWDDQKPVERGTPGLYAISINYVMGDKWHLYSEYDYRFFADESPIHICGDTILIYRLPSR